MTVLTKEQLGQCIDEMRDHWNGWDPLGVCPGMDGAPFDEYDAYLGMSLSHLINPNFMAGLTDFLNFVLTDQMELTAEEVAELDPDAFAERLQAWFAGKQVP